MTSSLCWPGHVTGSDCRRLMLKLCLCSDLGSDGILKCYFIKEQRKIICFKMIHVIQYNGLDLPLFCNNYTFIVILLLAHWQINRSGKCSRFTLYSLILYFSFYHTTGHPSIDATSVFHCRRSNDKHTLTADPKPTSHGWRWVLDILLLKHLRIYFFRPWFPREAGPRLARQDYGRIFKAASSYAIRWRVQRLCKGNSRSVGPQLKWHRVKFC